MNGDFTGIMISHGMVMGFQWDLMAICYWDVWDVWDVMAMFLFFPWDFIFCFKKFNGEGLA